MALTDLCRKSSNDRSFVTPPELELLGLRTALLGYVDGFREQSRT